MTRPEKAIPPDRPLKPLAEHLRALRQRAGSPSYRDMGALAYTKHNALSQVADGRWVGWPSVEKYVDALRAYAHSRNRPDPVTEHDLARLRQLHDAARAWRTRQPAGDPTGNRSLIEARARSMVLDESSTRWRITQFADWRRLGVTTSLDDLLACLSDLARSQGLTLTAPPSTLNGVLRVVRQAGGADGDCRVWESAWRRIHDAHRRAEESFPSFPSERNAGAVRYPEWGPTTTSTNRRRRTFGVIARLMDDVPS